MLRKLTLDQINDWFTIGKTVTNVELLGAPPALRAEAPLRLESSETEYVKEYRQLEAQELDLYGSTHTTGQPVPQYLLDYCIERSVHCNIVVTQPRRIGASSIARWISKERSWTLGGMVGYQVGLEKIATEDTKLIYVTTGVLLQKLVSAKSLMEFTHIFIDEVHERTEEMDFLLLVVRKLLRTNSRFVKVILMSATINCQEFADYFAVPVQNKMKPAHVFEVEGKPHAIEEYYLDDLVHIDHRQLSPHILKEPVMTKDMYKVAVSLIQMFDDLDLKESRAVLPEKVPQWGLLEAGGLHNWDCWRAASPGKESQQGLLNVAGLHSWASWGALSSLTGLPLYSGVFISRVVCVPVPFVVEGIKCNLCAFSQLPRFPGNGTMFGLCSDGLVFCSGLGEINYMHELLTNMVHKRLQIYPLHSSVTLEEQNNVFLSPVPGYRKIILSTNIAESSVTVPDVKYGKLQLLLVAGPLFTLPSVSPPGFGSGLMVGALAVSGQGEDENPHDGELTFLGRVLAQLPVNQQLGKLIVLGHVFGCLDDCLIIAAALSLKSFFVMPFRQHLDGYRNKMNFAGDSKSDCIALVEAFKTWQACRQRGELRHPKDELEWGRLNYIQIKRIREVAELYEELKVRISQFNMHVGSRQPALDREYTYKQRFILQLKHIPPYGFLYHKQLQSLFRQCGQVKSIVFDGAKAFVEFSRNPTERFKTLPAVYLALKMPQLRVPLELSVHPAEEIEGKVRGGAVSKLRNTRVNVDFQKQTMDPMQVSFNTLDRSQSVTSLLLTVDVTEVVEVGHFWGYRVDEGSATLLQKLTAEINQLQLVPLALHPHPDLVCLAPFADSDGERYFRAQILYVSGPCAEVFFVDYGNRARVDLDLLMEIPCQFLELPFQALEFKICQMRPSAQSLVCGERWSCRASQRFASLVRDCELLVKVFSVVHGVLRVDVYRCSGVQDTINVRDVLIQEGYAEFTEESYESKQSHEVLKGLFSKSVENSPGTDRSVPSPMKENENYLVQILLESCCSHQLGAPNCKAVLRGPFNPYELKCHSLTRISKFRCVWIEKESINSIIISDAPEDLHQRMLVAASLLVNATGSTMLLRETSVMPHIPGLPALLSMLFAPVMELRVDQDGKGYTGVLCGLGWNPTTGTPILPEHDIELAFDVQFTMEDIVEVNILRAAINKLICDGPNGSKNLGPERIAQLQDNARQKLLGLFCQLKPRERVVPKWYEKPYEWNQVDPTLVMETADWEGSRRKSPFLYQLHKLVVLAT
ncbi:ATP-dependent RNA helicase TDRD9 [Orycteropus afer afer]|uniref:RNA helicase n=1 Tax=Orycteropus afer afer TaxID=1230840 RepID=A0A8B7A4D1_ORYAF|nr:ATP-dependent RNA helicase TDRD9 [Orycteropus afer afer]